MHIAKIAKEKETLLNKIIMAYGELCFVGRILFSGLFYAFNGKRGGATL